MQGAIGMASCAGVTGQRAGSGANSRSVAGKGVAENRTAVRAARMVRVGAIGSWHMECLLGAGAREAASPTCLPPRSDPLATDPRAPDGESIVCFDESW